MELLRFDSRRPNTRYAEMVELLRQKLANVLVSRRPEFYGVPLPIGIVPPTTGIGMSPMAMA
jgi:hypothetical protein